MKDFLRLLLFVFINIACEKVVQPYDGFKSEIVVECHLQANKPFNKLLLFQTEPMPRNLDQYSSQQNLQPTDLDSLYENRISGASVSISSSVETYYLIEDTLLKGRYIYPFPDSFIIKSGETYHLSITYQDKIIKSQTTVPSIINIKIYNPVQGNEVYYPGNKVEFLPESNNHAGFFINIIREPVEWDDSLKEIHSADCSDGQICYDSYTNENYYLTSSEMQKISWAYFIYYEFRNIIKIYAIDQNEYDFWSSLKTDFNNYSPIKYNITNGIGIFGSYAVDSLFVVIKEGP